MSSKPYTFPGVSELLLGVPEDGQKYRFIVILNIPYFSRFLTLHSPHPHARLRFRTQFSTQCLRVQQSIYNPKKQGVVDSIAIEPTNMLTDAAIPLEPTRPVLIVIVD